MDKAIKIIKEEFLNSFKIIKDNGLYIFLPMLADLLFIFTYGFVTSPLFAKILEYFYKTSSLVTQASVNLDTMATSSLWGVIESAGAASYAKSFILLLLIALAAAYVMYSFFMGISWCFCYRMAGKKQGFTEFAASFAKVNLFWLALFVVYYISNFIYDFITTLSQIKAAEIVDSKSILLTLLLFLIFYFAYISYALIGKQGTRETIKQAFKIGTKKLQYTIPVVVIIGVIFLAINFLLAALSDTTSIILVGTITVLPAYVWGRIFILSVVQRIQ